jgi:hypothetical protein
MNNEEMVKDFFKMGFIIKTRFFFSLILKKGNVEIYIDAKEAYVEMYDEKKEFYKRSKNYKNIDLLNIVKEGRLPEIPLTIMPF